MEGRRLMYTSLNRFLVTGESIWKSVKLWVWEFELYQGGLSLEPRNLKVKIQEIKSECFALNSWMSFDEFLKQPVPLFLCLEYGDSDVGKEPWYLGLAWHSLLGLGVLLEILKFQRTSTSDKVILWPSWGDAKRDQLIILSANKRQCHFVKHEMPADVSDGCFIFKKDLVVCPIMELSLLSDSTPSRVNPLLKSPYQSPNPLLSPFSCSLRCPTDLHGATWIKLNLCNYRHFPCGLWLKGIDKRQ